MGGSVQTRDPVESNLPARISAMRVPQMLRAQGIENINMFDCIVQTPRTTNDVNVQPDDIVIPVSGQYKDEEFAVMGVGEDSVADNPNDFRRHKLLSLRRVEKARTIQ